MEIAGRSAGRWRRPWSAPFSGVSRNRNWGWFFGLALGSEPWHTSAMKHKSRPDRGREFSDQLCSAEVADNDPKG